MKQTFTSSNTYSVSHATMVYYNRTSTTFVQVEFIKKMAFICAHVIKCKNEKLQAAAFFEKYYQS